MAKGSAGYQYNKKHGRRAQERAAVAILRDAQLHQEQPPPLEQELTEVSF
jgi:hypothetical protein